MGFNRRDIRKALDVYTLDNVYLGSVLKVTPGAASPTVGQEGPAAAQTSNPHGELLGPMPTQPLGNPGPTTQSAANAYATAHASSEQLGAGTITVGQWWGLVNRRIIPLEAVQAVSLERVILKYRAHELQAYLAQHRR